MHSEYLLTNPKLINKHLSLLVSSGFLVTLHIDDKQSFMTMILHVDQEKKILIVDNAPDELLNKKILTQKSVRFSGTYQGIDFSFQSNAIRSGRFRNQPVFGMALPKDLFWRQRREFYRIRSPQHRNSWLSVPNSGDMWSLSLLDLSLSGAAVLGTPDIDREQITEDTVLPDCRLTLDGQGEGEVTIKIIYQHPLNIKKPQLGIRVGVKFLSMERGVELKIQRYMRELERELLQKMEG